MADNSVLSESFSPEKVAQLAELLRIISTDQTRQIQEEIGEIRDQLSVSKVVCKEQHETVIFDIKVLKEQHEAIILELKALKEQHETMILENASLKKQQVIFVSQNTDLKHQQQVLVLKIAELKEANEKLALEITALKKENVLLLDAVDMYESYTRKNSMVIFGLTETEDWSPEQTLRDICDALAVKLGDDSINEVYRIGLEKGKRPIICKMNSLIKKREIMMKNRQLGSDQFSIYDDLTVKEREIRKILKPYLDKALQNGQRAVIRNGKLFMNGETKTLQQILEKEMIWDEDPVAAGDGNLVAAGDENFVVAGDKNPVIAGDVDPMVAGNENLVAAGDENSVVAGDENPVIVGDEDPMVAGTEDPMVAGNENLVAAGDENPVAADDENLMAAGKDFLELPDMPDLIHLRDEFPRLETDHLPQTEKEEGTMRQLGTAATPTYAEAAKTPPPLKQRSFLEILPSHKLPSCGTVVSPVPSS